MRWETNNGFYEDNKDYVHTFIIVMVLCLAGVWLCYDNARNRPVYKDTDNAMADVNKRIENLEQRINRIQERNSAIEKAVSGISATVTAGRENAVTVADGIERADERLDGIIQRQGRIENIIADIEAKNRQRKVHSQETVVAEQTLVYTWWNGCGNRNRSRK